MPHHAEGQEGGELPVPRIESVPVCSDGVDVDGFRRHDVVCDGTHEHAESGELSSYVLFQIL